MALSKETVNYTRCCYVAVEIFPEILRRILQTDIPPHDIKVRASGLRNLTAEERTLLEDASSQGYSNFDVTFLYKIIRNINLPSVTPPGNGWGQLPSTPSNNTIGDVIERIRHLRNKVYGHANSNKMSDTDFNQHWSDFSDICQGVDSSFPSSASTFVSLLSDIKKTEFCGNTHTKIVEIVNRHIRHEEQIEVLHKRIENVSVAQRDVNAAFASNLQKQEAEKQAAEKKFSEIDSHFQRNEKRQRKFEEVTENMGSTLQRHEETFAAIRSPTISQQKYIPQDDTQGLQDTLVEKYQNATDNILLNPFDKITMPLRQLFSHVVVVDDTKKTIEKAAEMFFNDKGKPVKRIFMIGEAGRGKTVYGLKLSEEWCNVRQGKQSDMQEALSQFEFLFHVSMRHLEPNRNRVVDMICDCLSEGDPYLVDLITRVLCNRDIRCLVVLDGLDEWSSDYDYFPQTYGLVNCVLFTTSRPWKLEELEMDYSPPQDKVVEILGINPKSIETLITRVVTHLFDSDDQGVTDRLISYCKQRASDLKMEEFIKLPLILTAYCHVWCEEKTKESEPGSERNADKSMTYLSLAVLDMLIKRAKKTNKEVRDYLKKNFHTQTESTSDTMTSMLTHYFPKLMDFFNILIPFCKVAYNDLISKATRLVFMREKLEREMGRQTVELALKVGVISQCWAPSSGISIENVSVSFFHKLIQELMAAMYIVCNPDLLPTFCHQCDTIDKILGLSNVIMYLTGLDGELGCQLSQHVRRIAQTDQSILLWRETMEAEHGDKVWSLYRSQRWWYDELVYFKTLMGISTPIPYHISDVCLMGASDSEIVRVTEEMMSNSNHTVVSVHLFGLTNVSNIIGYLPQHSTSLTALSIALCHCELLVSVLPLLTQLQCILYWGNMFLMSDVDARIVAALTQLPRLKSVMLMYIGLNDTILNVSQMTQLVRLKLQGIFMSSRKWRELLSSLLSIPQKVKVKLESTQIDADSLTMIKSSPRFTLIEHNRDKDFIEFYKEA